jgi:putative sterol carrier protein
MPLYNRKDMPQVNTQKLSTAIDMVKSKVKVTKTVLLARKLKQSQKELIPSKVKGVAKKYSKPMDMKPLIISKDNYIVDGHHRWAAGLYKFGKEVKLPVFIIQLKKENAIKLYKSIANSLNEDITIPINVGDTVLGGKFKNKRIVVKSIGKNEKGDITINNKPLLKFRILPKVDESVIGDKIECDNCGWEWEVSEGGNDLYMCHKCGHDNEPKTSGLPIIKRDGGGNLNNNNSGQYSKVTETWSSKYKKSIDCNNPKGFSQKAHCAGKRKKESKMNEGCWKGYKQVGGKKKNGKMVPNCVPINEIPMGDLKKIDTFADKKLNPVDVVLTDKHFFDRLNDPRNNKEISSAELIGFFKRLAKKKKTFLDFLDKYNQVVASDDRTNINIPFMKQANKVIAKTVMRKKDFKTQNQKVEI